MKVGYARVSTKDQNLDRQLDALEKEGCDKIFYDKLSTRKDRLERNKAFESLKEGDTFVFLDLDRVFRSITEALNTFEQFEARGIRFKCINNPYLNTTGEQDKVGKVLQKIVRSLISGFAEMEREMNYERTMEGLNTAKQRGKVGGRPSKIKDPKFMDQVKEIQALQGSSNKSIRNLCNLFGVPIATYYRYKDKVVK
jgi:DNA invertase Pin-like site-specific DNA recombinase|tara:strand:- start:171 stop:761 length:591 start_codon:yes stop_codon:yes gene_type:complete